MKFEDIEETVNKIIDESIDFDKFTPEDMLIFSEKFNELEETIKSSLVVKIIDNISEKNLLKGNFNKFLTQDNTKEILLEYIKRD